MNSDMGSAIASFFSKYGIWMAVPGFFVGAGLLIYFIKGVVKVGDRARMFSVPLLEQQLIEFPEAREVILWGEGPLFSSRFAKLDFELKSEDDGIPVEGHTIWIHSSSSGLSKARIDLKRFHIPRPGRYRLEIQDLGEPRENDAGHQLVFMKPHRMKTIAYILGIILSAFIFIGSIVLFFLSLLLPKAQS
jgi:hypothetical protein